MPLTGNVNYAQYFNGQVTQFPPLEDGWGGLVTPTTDISGIQLSIGDVVVFPNPTPGSNGLPNTPDCVGMIVAFGGSLCTVNVPSVTQLSAAVAVYNILTSEARQIYSAMPGNAETGVVQAGPG